MKARPFTRPPGISGIALRWVLAAAALGAVLLTAQCLIHNLVDEEYFSRHFITHETHAVASSMTLRDGRPVVTDPADLPYFSAGEGAYGFRVFDAGGRELASRNSALMDGQPAPGAHDLWFRKTGSAWLHLAGGTKQRIGGREVYVEIATAGDPRWRSRAVLVHELAEDVWLPLIPALLLTGLFLAWGLHRALKPLCEAASRARSLDVERGLKSIETSGLPREAAEFAASMNALMTRMDRLMRSREHLASYVAHEVKTPLASMLLDLEQIVDKRARRLEADVMALSGTVDDILGFARSGKVEAETVCLETIVRECVARAQAAGGGGHEITIAVDRPARVEGYAAAARCAVQNIIWNAVKHTPPGTAIRITCGPGPAVTIEDSGPGIPEADAARLTGPFERGDTGAAGSGLGLAIARHGAEQMGGTLEIGRSSLGGAAFRLRYGTRGGGANWAAAE